MNRILLNNQKADFRFQLECLLYDYGRIELKERLGDEKIPISTSALDNAAEIYSEKLMKTLEICMSNLIEADVSNLRSIFEKIKES